MRWSHFVVTAISTGMLLIPVQAPAERETAIIGTGSQAGVYYPTGVAIATIVNRKGDLRLAAESTKGSIRNINSCSAGKRPFGIAQSDRLHKAFVGEGFWEDKGPQKDLRTVFSIYPEYVTLIAAVDAQITSLADLEGKRVHVGTRRGDGMSVTVGELLDSAGLDIDRDIKAQYGKSREAPFKLHEGSLDAFFFIVAHPNGMSTEAILGKRKTKFIDIRLPEGFLRKYPYYIKGRIPMSLYPRATNTSDVDTIGVTAVLFTSTKVPDAMVYRVTKRMIENFDEFKSKHPAYQLMTTETMLSGTTAPWHPGALEYFREVGLMK